MYFTVLEIMFGTEAGKLSKFVCHVRLVVITAGIGNGSKAFIWMAGFLINSILKPYGPQVCFRPYANQPFQF